MRDVDGGSDEELDGGDDLNPRGSTTTAILQESFRNISGLFVQVVTLDSASFALTSISAVYDWGNFRVHTLLSRLTIF